MTEIKISDIINNININSVSECNLLCKLIIDYLPSNKITLNNYQQTPEPPSVIKNIELEEGNFINFQDISYLATKCFFFQPSRHLIDGERFDFEINIYHGAFSADKGYSTHLHYHTDKVDSNQEVYHQDLHYHKKNDTTHHGDKADKNIILSLLFNIDSHKGTDVNVFFDQFIHSDKFNNFLNKDTPNHNEKINTHKYYSFNNLLPKRRSFFQYEDKNKHTNIVFDSIQSIDKSIIKKFIDTDFLVTLKDDVSDKINKINNVLYKKNIEVITDERYKKLVRLQVKKLLSLNRIIPALNKGEVAADYYDRADKIYNNFIYKYLDYTSNLDKAIKLSDKWKDYGSGPLKEDKFLIIYDSLSANPPTPPTQPDAVKYELHKVDFIPGFNYLKKFENIFKGELEKLKKRGSQ